MQTVAIVGDQVIVKAEYDPARWEIALMAWERSGHFSLALSPCRLSSHPKSCPCLSVMLNHLREDTECSIADPKTVTLPLIPLRLDGPLDRKGLSSN